jgi:hypothetical protein
MKSTAITLALMLLCATVLTAFEQTDCKSRKCDCAHYPWPPSCDACCGKKLGGIVSADTQLTVQGPGDEAPQKFEVGPTAISRNLKENIKVGDKVEIYYQKSNGTPTAAKVDLVASVAVTKIPHAGPGGEESVELIQGNVSGSGVGTGAMKIVVYAYAGGVWWVQPSSDRPLTDVSADGSWETETHLGSIYAALLVRNGFQPPTKANSLPTSDTNVLAYTRVEGTTRKSSGAEREGPGAECTGAPAGTTAAVSVTQIPHAGSGGEEREELIGGAVLGGGAKPDRAKVVVYAHAGGVWYVQPRADKPLTDINADGTWETETHLGSTYVVLLVQAPFQPPPKAAIPPASDAHVLACAEADGRR